MEKITKMIISVLIALVILAAITGIVLYFTPQPAPQQVVQDTYIPYNPPTVDLKLCNKIKFYSSISLNTYCEKWAFSGSCYFDNEDILIDYKCIRWNGQYQEINSYYRYAVLNKSIYRIN